MSAKNNPFKNGNIFIGCRSICVIVYHTNCIFLKLSYATSPIPQICQRKCFTSFLKVPPLF